MRPKIETHRRAPEIELESQPFARGSFLKEMRMSRPKRSTQPSLDRAKPVRVGPFRFEIAQQRQIDPFGFVFIRVVMSMDGLSATWHNQTVRLAFDPLQFRAFKPFWMMERITIQVPASTSNLGPGFDCLGVALRLYNFVTITRGGERRSSPIVDEAARKFFKESRAGKFSIFLRRSSGEVPSSRGLGGSATIRLGVLHGLNRLAGNPLDRLSIFQLCAQLEGHPDNAAPASFGGFTVARGETVQRFEVSPRLHFVLLIPRFRNQNSESEKSFAVEDRSRCRGGKLRQRLCHHSRVCLAQLRKSARRIRRSSSSTVSAKIDSVSCRASSPPPKKPARSALF